MTTNDKRLLLSAQAGLAGFCSQKNVLHGHILTLQVVDWNIKAMEKPIC